MLAYPGCFGAELFGLVDVLGIANAVSAALRPGVGPPFAARVVSVRGTRVPLAGSASVHADRTGPADLVVVPGFEFVDPSTLDELFRDWAPELRYLRGLAAGRTELASICVGAFLLGEAGLLDGHQATTSWLFAPELSRRYPRVTVLDTAIVLEDGRIATSGAFSTSLDLALRLVHRHAGDEIGRATARITLTSATRTSQAPYVDADLMPVGPARFSDDVRDWLRQRIAEPYDLGRLAAAFHVSTRTMLRRFGEETRQSPLAFLQRTRIATAKRLLETSDLSVQAIQTEVGYQDAATFRKLFTSLAGTTPSDYRRQFRPRRLAA